MLIPYKACIDTDNHSQEQTALRVQQKTDLYNNSKPTYGQW